MTTIYGHVKLKETAEPIADLTVLIAARETLKAPARTNPNASNPFQRYTRTLASALTDAEGKFRIEFDNEARAKSKSQRQTELMLAVLAPATVSAANQSSSNEPFDRLLYWVKLSESAPARTEALAIRLLNGQLDKFDIQVPSRRLKADAERQAAHLIEAEKNSEKLRASIQKELGPLYKKRFEHKRKINAVAKQFASNLYATPKAARSQRNFALSPDQAETAKRNVMEDGLAAMADAASQAKGVTSVYMNPDGMKILGVDEPVAGQAIRIETDKLCQLMNERRGGTELVRVRELLDAYEAKEKANARIGQKGGASPHGSGGSAEETPPAEEAVTPDAAIAQRVLGQLKDMPTVISDNRGSLPKTLTREELNALLPAVQLGAGPTDVPSFHDFYNLQIAFRHVWTEAFDKDLREAIEDLYKDYVQVNEDYSTPVLPGVELQEKEDLLAFLAEVKKLDSAHDRPPTHVSATFDVTSREWNSLSPDQQSELKALSKEIGDTPEDQQDTLVKEGRAIIAAAMGYMTRIARLLSEIALRINEPYSFHHFMPNAVNVGILLTYRQYWQPGPYQVGDLVSTIPLAPGEKRGFEIKQTIKRSRAETELRKSLSSKSVEATTTQRADAEITEKAALRSNFQMTAEGSFRFGIGEISSGTQFGIDRSQESSRTKRDFREAVLKAAQEYRQERTLEVHTTDEHAAESTTSGELSNPNNELTVTYLLYELERQYTISERIHRVTPVILVAQAMPAPNEITESWLLAHEWILRRVLLDDSLRPALDNLSDAFAGEEVSISVRKAVWEKQVALVSELEATVRGFKTTRDELRDALIQMAEESALTDVRRKEILGEALKPLKLKELIAGLEEAAELKMDVEQFKILKQSLESRLRYLEDSLKEAQERFGNAQEALNQATSAYTSALETQTNRRVAIDQLRIHVKEYILYYMQAIWDHEPPDQRFFRLYHVEVALPESPTGSFGFRRATEDDLETGIPTVEYGGERYVIELDPPAPPDPAHPNTKRLVEIADLDHPLGYKGNYIIFPLKTCLYLTNFMMREFFDDYFGVRDPDVAANFSVEELLTYAEALIRDGHLTEEQRAALQSIIMTKLRQPRRDSDLVVVPTGELFMEALMGEHPLLENFKLNHRFVDMAKARAEWRQAEIENLRRAARLLQEQPNLQDPDADRHIIVEGASDVHVGTP